MHSALAGSLCYVLVFPSEWVHSPFKQKACNGGGTKIPYNHYTIKTYFSSGSRRRRGWFFLVCGSFNHNNFNFNFNSKFSFEYCQFSVVVALRLVFR